MMKYLAAFLLLASAARAEFVGVYIPLCFAPQATPIEALRIKQPNWPTREIRPMWSPMGGRTNIFHYGFSDRPITFYTVKGGIETKMMPATASTVNPADCSGQPTGVDPNLSTFYGIREQTLRAIQQLYTTTNPKPIDTDQDGTVRSNDMQLIWDHVLGRFPDFTYNVCTAEVCP